MAIVATTIPSRDAPTRKIRAPIHSLGNHCLALPSSHSWRAGEFKKAILAANPIAMAIQITKSGTEPRSAGGGRGAWRSRIGVAPSGVWAAVIALTCPLSPHRLAGEPQRGAQQQCHR